MPGLRIATFNVNGIRSRLPHLLQWLERERPDIACLQELKAPDDAFPRSEIAAAGYGACWHGQRSWNGVAILVRGADPIETRRGLPGDPDDTHSRYIEAVAHGIVVGCLYLPNGNPQPGPKFAYKLRWFERLIQHAAALLQGGHPVVLAGDYNVVPTDELDIYNPRSWRRDALLQPESRACWFRLLEQGWTDALRTLHPDERIYTFWDYFRQHWPRDAGLRIDHLLLSPPLSGRLQGAGVDRWVRGLEGASDHAPTWIELSSKPAKPTSRTTGRRVQPSGPGTADATESDVVRAPPPTPRSRGRIPTSKGPRAGTGARKRTSRTTAAETPRAKRTPDSGKATQAPTTARGKTARKKAGKRPAAKATHGKSATKTVSGRAAPRGKPIGPKRPS